MIINLFTLSDAPGCSTLGVAMSVFWPRPTLLIEADLTHSSTVLTGWFRGEHPHKNLGILQVTDLHRRGAITEPDLIEQSIELIPNRRVIPGFPTPATAANAELAWGSVFEACRGFEKAGTDVIVDLGRLTADDPRNNFLANADASILLAPASMSGLYSVAKRGEEITKILDAGGNLTSISLALAAQAAGPSYEAREAKQVVPFKISATLPHDPQTASVFSTGQPLTKKAQRSAYRRAVSSLGNAVTSDVLKRREALGERKRPTTPLTEGASQ